MKQKLHFCFRLFFVLTFVTLNLQASATPRVDATTETNATALPKVYITTPNGQAITSKDIWLEGCNVRIVDATGKEVLNQSASMKGRGNSTWVMPKKPYAIKLDSKKAVLGMPKHKRWVLLANWLDRTDLRNDVSLELARRFMAWAPRGQFVEMYFNGKHQGNYYLCEQIKLDPNRVNIDEIDTDTPEEDLTGGYLLEYDTNNGDEIVKFKSDYYRLPVTVKDPDEEVITSNEHPAYKYIYNFIAETEQLIHNRDEKKVAERLDFNSYAEWWLVHELVTNVEAAHPKSCYMYKARNGKLFAGPAWDFDWGTFVDYGTSGALIDKSLYYKQLFEMPTFRDAVIKRWAALKPQAETLTQYIDQQANLIRNSVEVDWKMWPNDNYYTHPNKDDDLTFDEAVKNMKEVYTKRLMDVDNIVKNLQPSTAVRSLEMEADVQINGRQLTVSAPHQSIALYTVQGAMIDEAQSQLRTSLPKGVYVLRVGQKAQRILIR